MDIWKEGKYLDFWSIIHLVDGMFVAGIFILIGLKIEIGFLLSFIISVVWELVEPPEAFWNKILDVITTMAGFLLYIPLKSELMFWIAAILAVSLNVWAWIFTGNYKKFLRKKSQ